MLIILSTWSCLEIRMQDSSSNGGLLAHIIKKDRFKMAAKLKMPVVVSTR